MDIDDLVAELLAGSLDQFTAARNARANELKAGGNPDLASQAAGLKKPSVALWAANKAAREDPAMLRNLRQSAEALAKAQTAGRPEARSLRAASDDFQKNLDAAVTPASAVLRRDGHAANEDALRRIREIFRLAALQGGDVWKRLEKGALITDPEPGDDVISMFQASAAGPAPKPTKPDAQAEARRAREAGERQAEEDAARAEQAEATARRLRAEVREAVAAAERAEQRAKAAEEEAARAKAQAKKSAKAAGK